MLLTGVATVIVPPALRHLANLERPSRPSNSAMASSSDFLLFLSVIWIASLARVAYGHGFVHTVVIGDASYPGWNPFVDPCAFHVFVLIAVVLDCILSYASPIPSRIVRKIPNDGYSQLLRVYFRSKYSCLIYRAAFFV